MLYRLSYRPEIPPLSRRAPRTAAGVSWISPPRSAMSRLRVDTDELEESLPPLGQRVERHLALTPIIDEATRAQHAQMMRDQVLRPLDDPREIADTKLAAAAKRQGEGQPSRVRKSAERFRETLGDLLPEARRAQRFRTGQVETKKIALVVRHFFILMVIDTFSLGFRTWATS